MFREVSKVIREVSKVFRGVSEVLREVLINSSAGKMVSDSE